MSILLIYAATNILSHMVLSYVVLIDLHSSRNLHKIDKKAYGFNRGMSISLNTSA